MPDQQTYSDNLHLRSEEVQEIITAPPAWLIRWGITLVFILTCLIILLSFFIKYPDYIQAKVLVTTRQPTERVVARTSGQIEKLFVENGDQVIAGQALAGIKNTANWKHVLYLKETLEDVPFGRGNDFTFPIDSFSNLILGEVEVSFLEFERNYMEYWLLEELQPYEGEIDGNHRSLEEINNRLQNQIAQKVLMERKRSLVQIDFERSKNLHKDGVIADKDFEIKEMEYLLMQEQVNSITIAISQMQEALTRGNQTLRSTQINKREDEARSIKNLVQSYHELKRAVRDWEYNYVLSSSTGGVVSFQKIWSANQQVYSGEPAFTVFPENSSELIGTMKIPAHNAGKVTVNQKVFIKLDNYPYQQFGALTGKITNMSVSPDDEANYMVFASLPHGTKTSYNREIPLNQELLGNAEIITENLSVAERLFFKLNSFMVY